MSAEPIRLSEFCECYFTTKTPILMPNHLPFSEVHALPISLNGKRSLVSFRNILRLEADRNYTWIHLADGTKALSCRNLSNLQDNLPEDFVRVGRSHLVNRHFLLGISDKSKELSLPDDSRIPIPRRNAKRIRQKLLTQNL